MSRPASVRQQWLQLRRTLSTAPSTLHPRPNIAPCASLRVTNKNGPSTPRPFHTTPPRPAQRKPRPAPSTRARIQASQTNSSRSAGALFDKDGLLQRPLTGHASVEEVLLDFSVLMDWQYNKAQKEGFLPSQISFRTYRDVSEKLIRQMYSSAPSAQAIRAISIGMCLRALSISQVQAY